MIKKIDNIKQLPRDKVIKGPKKPTDKVLVLKGEGCIKPIDIDHEGDVRIK